MTKSALLFPGQGSQSLLMGKDLYDNFESAKRVFQEIDDVLNKKLTSVIFGENSDELTKTENAQPALMAVSAAIITILEKDFDKNVSDLCSFVAGHSLGEYSALFAAKSLSLENATKLLKIRSEAMAKCALENSGAMAAVINLESEKIAEICQKYNKNSEICQIANDNSSNQVVISGSKSAVENACVDLKAAGVKRALMLPVAGAFHSKLMSGAAEIMQENIENFEFKKPTVPVVANVLAEATSDENQIKKLLVSQITGSVRWRESMIYLKNQNVEKMIELGAGKVLTNLVSKSVENVEAISIQNMEDIKNFVA